MGCTWRGGKMLRGKKLETLSSNAMSQNAASQARHAPPPVSRVLLSSTSVNDFLFGISQFLQNLLILFQPIPLDRVKVYDCDDYVNSGMIDASINFTKKFIFAIISLSSKIKAFEDN